jgi:hypothetical protein
MRIAQACAIAALIGFSGAAYAQTQTTTPGQLNQSGVLPGTNNPNNGGPGSNLTGAVSGNGPMNEGRASAPDTMQNGAMQNRSMHNGMTHKGMTHGKKTMDRHNGS